jgi:hypothetical protein
MVFADTENGWNNKSQRGVRNEQKETIRAAFKKKIAQVYLSG